MKYKPPLSKPTADYTLLLDESRLRTEDLWNELANQGASRLGSVLTNSKGLFELRYDEDRERGRDDSRADLVLFILGPETTHEANDGSV